MSFLLYFFNLYSNCFASLEELQEINLARTSGLNFFVINVVLYYRYYLHSNCCFSNFLKYILRIYSWVFYSDLCRSPDYGRGLNKFLKKGRKTPDSSPLFSSAFLSSTTTIKPSPSFAKPKFSPK